MSELLHEHLELLLEDMENTKELIGTSPGPLEDPEKAQAKGQLDSAEQHIEDALAQVNNLGIADPLNLPSTLAEIAAECNRLAHSAKTEARRPVPNSISIGSSLKTIDRMIKVDEGYRDRSGAK